MNDHPQPSFLTRYVEYIPLAGYFLLKYLVIGVENLQGWKSLALLAAAILASAAIRKYRKQRYGEQPAEPPENDPTA